MALAVAQEGREDTDLGACLLLVVTFLPRVPCRDDCSLTVSRERLHETQQMRSELSMKLAGMSPSVSHYLLHLLCLLLEFTGPCDPTLEGSQPREAMDSGNGVPGTSCCLFFSLLSTNSHTKYHLCPCCKLLSPHSDAWMLALSSWRADPF